MKMLHCKWNANYKHLQGAESSDMKNTKCKKTLRLTQLLCGTPTFVRGTCAFIKWIMCPQTNYVYEMRNTVKCEAEIMNIAFYWYWLRSDLDKLVGETNVFV